MAGNMKKIWVKTNTSVTATRITISGDADIYEVVEAAIGKMNCLDGISEDMVTVACNGKDISKSLKVDIALQEGYGVSDRNDAVLLLQLSEVWVKCDWSSAVTRIMISPDARIADLVDATIAKMGMHGVTEDVVTVLCSGKEVNKSLAVHAALKEGFGVSDKIDEVLMLHTSEVWVKAEMFNTSTRVLINEDARIEEVVQAAIRKLKDLEDVSEDMITVSCNGQEIRKGLSVRAALEQNFGVSDEDDKVLLLHHIHTLGVGKIHLPRTSSEPSDDELTESPEPEGEEPFSISSSTLPVSNDTKSPDSSDDDMSKYYPYQDIFMMPLHRPLFQTGTSSGIGGDSQLSNNSLAQSSSNVAMDVTGCNGEEPSVQELVGADSKINNMSNNSSQDIAIEESRSPASDQMPPPCCCCQSVPASPWLKTRVSPEHSSPNKLPTPPSSQASQPPRRKISGPGGGSSHHSTRPVKLHITKVNSPPSVKSFESPPPSPGVPKSPAMSSTLHPSKAQNSTPRREPYKSPKVGKASLSKEGSLNSQKPLTSGCEHASRKHVTPGQSCTCELCRRKKREQGSLKRVQSSPLGVHLGRISKAPESPLSNRRMNSTGNPSGITRAANNTGE